MMHGDLMRMQSLGTALNLETFWNWLHEHHNCIVRAGTSDAWLYDQDDLHWHLYEDMGSKYGVQLMRGKQTVAELAIGGSDVMYVEMAPSSETQGHFEFQLMGGQDQDMYAVYHFVMAHGYEEDTHTKPATH